MTYSQEKGGKRVPDDFPPVIDSHVHVFPENIFKAIWKWFDAHAWPIRYQMNTKDLFDFLLARQIKHIIALQYSHKPGIARQLNQYLAAECQGYRGKVTGMATVFPGEDEDVAILQDAFDAGLGGLKLHVHVQCFDMTSTAVYRLLDCCDRNGKPVVIHAGREPKSDAYQCDPYQLCAAPKVEQILRDFPSLKLCVPHLGFDEDQAYRKLIENYDTLWLDTAMVATDYFYPGRFPDLSKYRSNRVMYGSDFPNIPFAWDRELGGISQMNLPENVLADLLGNNAVEFFGLSGVMNTP